MIRVRRIGMQLPTLRLPMPLMRKVGAVVEGSILDNIASQKQADGSPLKANAPSTLERKRRLGRPLLSLVDELHRFVQRNQGSWRIATTDKRSSAIVVIEPATPQLRKLVRWVQEKGYVGWFDINKKGVAAIRALLRRWLREEFARAAKRRGRRRR